MNSYHFCRTQYENLGDLIINKMLIDELSLYGNVYLDVANAPLKFIKPLLSNSKVINFNELTGYCNNSGIKNGLTILFFLLKYKVKLFTAQPGPLTIVEENSKRSSLRRLIDTLYKIAGIKKVLFGSCASDLICMKSEYDFSRFDKALLRSFPTVEYFENKSRHNNVSYIPDLCFLYKYYIKKKTEKKKIAILDMRLSENNQDHLIEWCRRLVRTFADQNFEIIIYYQVERDLIPSSMIFDRIKAPNVSFRRDIVWFDDLDFYSDKMFVISNRLHSLLLGAAYGAYPICLFEETPKLLKIKHVFSSAFSKDIPMIYENYTIPDTNLEDMYNKYSNRILNEYAKNAQMCRNIIKSTIDQITQ